MYLVIRCLLNGNLEYKFIGVENSWNFGED